MNSFFHVKSVVSLIIALSTMGCFKQAPAPILRDSERHPESPQTKLQKKKLGSVVWAFEELSFIGQRIQRTLDSINEKEDANPCAPHIGDQPANQFLLDWDCPQLFANQLFQITGKETSRYWLEGKDLSKIQITAEKWKVFHKNQSFDRQDNFSLRKLEGDLDANSLIYTGAYLSEQGHLQEDGFQIVTEITGRFLIDKDSTKLQGFENGVLKISFIQRKAKKEYLEKTSVFFQNSVRLQKSCAHPLFTNSDSFEIRYQQTGTPETREKVFSSKATGQLSSQLNDEQKLIAQWSKPCPL